MMLQKPLLVLYFVLFLFNSSLAQENKVFKVNGANFENVYDYLSIWIDTTKNTNFQEVALALSKDTVTTKNQINFKKNLGLNPYSTWYYLKIQNNSKLENNYWWSFYTHADSIYVYRKVHSNWMATDTLYRNQLLKNRKAKTRALTIPIPIKYEEKQEILVKLINKRHTQNAFSDLTTPEHNLLWEKKFYWSVGFFIGTFLIMALISFTLWVVQKKNIFLIFFLYLLVIIVITLSEELMNTVVSNQLLFTSINRFHSLPLSLLAVCFNYSIVSYIFQNKEVKIRSISFLNIVYKVGLLCSLLSLVLYFVFMNQLHFGQIGFLVFWKINLYLIFIIVAITVYKIIILSLQVKKILMGLFFILVMLVFNPAGYFLNYSGIVHYYEITYPNYFYWFVCAEFIFIGALIAWRFQKTTQLKYQLEIENANQEEQMMHKVLMIQEQERQQIARDLHDDLGATINAIKLLVTHNYSEDEKLKEMVTNASTDIRAFYKKLTVSSVDELSIKERVDNVLDLYKNISPITFNHIFIGNESKVSGIIRESLFKIFNEIITNILKHSKAKDVTIQFLIDEDIQLIVEDNGIGFNLEKAMNKEGMGLKNIHQRVKNRNGEIHISSTKGNTTIIITIPLHDV